MPFDRKAWAKAHYEKNKTKCKSRRKAWGEKNREHLARKHKEWYEQNKDHVAQYQREYLARIDGPIKQKAKVADRITFRNAAGLLGVPFGTLTEWIGKGYIPFGVAPTGRRFLRRSDIEGLLKRQPGVNMKMEHQMQEPESCEEQTFTNRIDNLLREEQP